LLDTESFYKNLQQKIEEELVKSSKLYASKYEEILKETQGQSIKILQNIPQDIKTVLAKEIQSVHITIEEEVKKAEEEAKGVVVLAYQKAESEVEKYKLARLRQVDESIVMILKEVARKVLSKEINMEEHEKLVMKALEEAKRQGVFEQGESAINKEDQNLKN